MRDKIIIASVMVLSLGLLLLFFHALETPAGMDRKSPGAQLADRDDPSGTPAPLEADSHGSFRRAAAAAQDSTVDLTTRARHATPGPNPGPTDPPASATSA